MTILMNHGKQLWASVDFRGEYESSRIIGKQIECLSWFIDMVYCSSRRFVFKQHTQKHKIDIFALTLVSVSLFHTLVLKRYLFRFWYCLQSSVSRTELATAQRNVFWSTQGYFCAKNRRLCDALLCNCNCAFCFLVLVFFPGQLKYKKKSQPLYCK